MFGIADELENELMAGYSGPQLRVAIADRLPKARNHIGKMVPVFPSLQQEWNAVLKEANYGIHYDEKLAPHLRVIIAADPMKQYTALVIKQVRFTVVSGQDGGEQFQWTLLKANGHTGPTIVGFEDALHAVAFAQEWLAKRAAALVSTAEGKKKFFENKGFLPQTVPKG